MRNEQNRFKQNKRYDILLYANSLTIQYNTKAFVHVDRKNLMTE